MFAGVRPKQAEGDVYPLLLMPLESELKNRYHILQYQI